MKFYIASSLLLALAAFAQNGAVGTPSGTGAGSGAGISQTAPGLGSSTVAPNPLPANPSVNPVPNTDTNANGTIINNPSFGGYDPVRPIQDSRQSQEENPAVLPGQPSNFPPPVNNPGQPGNVDANGRPYITP